MMKGVNQHHQYVGVDKWGSRGCITIENRGAHQAQPDITREEWCMQELQLGNGTEAFERREVEK